MDGDWIGILILLAMEFFLDASEFVTVFSPILWLPIVVMLSRARGAFTPVVISFIIVDFLLCFATYFLCNDLVN